MKRKPAGISYSGALEGFVSNKVYLHVTFLQPGRYEINIVHQNKIVKKVFFENKR